MSELDLTKPTASSGGGTPAKTVVTSTGALVANISKKVQFNGGATFPNANYVLQAQDLSGEAVLVDLLAPATAEETTHFSIRTAIDIVAGLRVVAIGS